jgi:bifunctional DNA-binding transcriptional regulator/antitoxin component of YhaV-PrlF toxin-antitoxin module
MATITIQNKSDLVVPLSVRRRAGIKTGDQVEFKVSGGVINIIPKRPSADEEYTPAQRRVINARLAKAEADIKKGRVYGPFETHQALINFLHSEVKKRKSKGKARTHSKSR